MDNIPESCYKLSEMIKVSFVPFLRICGIQSLWNLPMMNQSPNLHGRRKRVLYKKKEREMVALMRDEVSKNSCKLMHRII